MARPTLPYVDYASIELRIAALKLEYEERKRAGLAVCEKPSRQHAQTVNFAILYGTSDHVEDTLRKIVGLPPTDFR
jgi:DNA polymerase I-like protein with 3'-5' exonuclease and polymerase domains